MLFLIVSLDFFLTVRFIMDSLFLICKMYNVQCKSFQSFLFFNIRVFFQIFYMYFTLFGRSLFVLSDSFSLIAIFVPYFLCCCFLFNFDFQKLFSNFSLFTEMFSERKSSKDLSPNFSRNSFYSLLCYNSFAIVK